MIRTALLLALGMAACPSAGAAPGDPSLEFTARQLPAEEQVSQPTAGAEGGEGTITVTGRLSAPDPCREVTGALERGGDGVTLRVTVTPTAEMCAQVISAFAYTGTITGLAPGEYPLRVVHTYPQTGWETETVLEETVRVR